MCVPEGHGVFLDLKRDKYSAVVFPPEVANASLADKLATQHGALIEAGLFTTDATVGQPIAEASVEEIEGHIFGLDDQRAFGLTADAAEGLRIRLVEMWDLLLSSWKAADAGAAVDVEKVRCLTAIYRRLRPWWPRKYLCLYESLALVDLMARRGACPLWIFAVQAQPFGAHCWVQSGSRLLNEGSEYADQFTPIMAV